MSTNPPPNSDPTHGSLGDDATQQVIVPAQRAVAFYLKKSQTDLNQGPPQSQFDAFGKRFFEAAPVQLKNVFDSPMAIQGDNVVQGVRRVTSGWGDARAEAYDAEAKNGTRRHSGLDFAAPNGETISACADGIVTFVGFQNRPRGATSVTHPHSDSRGNVLDGNNKVVAQPKDLGHGGIFIQIKHNGDFEGYWTEYMHCSDTLVTQGQKVLKGAAIAKVGQTGGNAGITTGPHLHWQVRFRGVIVNPTFLVPHFRANAELVRFDGTIDSNTGTALASISQAKNQSVAEAMMTNNVANQLTGLERQAKCQNFDHSDFKQKQGEHAQLVATNLGIHVSALYEAIAKFQGAQPQVQDGLAFNFDTGLWTDQTSAPASGTGV